METQTAAGTPQKILVVDDSVVILKILAYKLKFSGYDVVTAADGAEAVAAARREKPDLILLDLFFPPDVAHGGGVPWDGFLIIGWLRRMDECRNIPIIIITGDEPGKNDQRALAAGAVAVFHKPIDHAALLAAIRDTIGPHSVPP